MHQRQRHVHGERIRPHFPGPARTGAAAASTSQVDIESVEAGSGHVHVPGGVVVSVSFARSLCC